MKRREFLKAIGIAIFTPSLPLSNIDSVPRLLVNGKTISICPDTFSYTPGDEAVAVNNHDCIVIGDPLSAEVTVSLPRSATIALKEINRLHCGH